MTTTTSTWPTAAELERAATLLDDANDALDELHTWASRYSYEEVNEPGTSTPTLEEIGRMSSFIANAEMHINPMQEQLDTVREARDTAALFMPASEVPSKG